MKAVYEWLGKHVHAWYGTFAFALLVFIEGFFVVPVSSLLAFFCLQNRPKAFHYALIATLVSALGAAAGYIIGVLIWNYGGESIITYFVSPERFEQLIDQFKMYQAWTTFAVAFTPMPFKLLTITAGFLRLPLITFIIMAMLARGCRFFGIAIAVYLWGEQVQYYLNRYFTAIALVITLLFVLLWFFIH